MGKADKRRKRRERNPSIHPYLLGNVAALPKRRGAAVNQRAAAPGGTRLLLANFSGLTKLRSEDPSGPYNTPLTRLLPRPTMQLSELSIISPRTNKFWPGGTRAPLSERQHTRYLGRGVSGAPWLLCRGGCCMRGRSPGSSDQFPPPGMSLPGLPPTRGSPTPCCRAASRRGANAGFTLAVPPVRACVCAHRMGNQAELKN